jgi:hypothetical protein
MCILSCAEGEDEMRFSRNAPIMSIGLAAAMAVLLAVPAEALWVRPSTAHLKDGDGDTNGCVVRASITKTTLEGSPDLGPGIFANTVVTCPATADVHRVSFRQNYVEVLSDGSFRTIGAGSTGGTSQGGSPITIPVSSGQFTPCSNPENRGTHTYLAKARVSAKKTVTYRDPNPYIGKVAALATLTC